MYAFVRKCVHIWHTLNKYRFPIIYGIYYYIYAKLVFATTTTTTVKEHYFKLYQVVLFFSDALSLSKTQSRVEKLIFFLDLAKKINF
jgi:hypothetical protein